MAQSTDDQITAEQAAITKAESAIAEANPRRHAALLADDRKTLESVDEEIYASKNEIARSRERIELLETQLTIERTAAMDAELDKLAAKAEQARKEGEQIIRDYRSEAAVIGSMLSKLKHIDEQITLANKALAAAGRASIASPNAARCKPAVNGTKTVRRRLGVGNQEHPLHKVATFDANGQARHRETGAYIETFGEFDVSTPYSEPGYYPAPLQDEVKLPRVDPNAPDDFWPRSNNVAEEPQGSPGIIGTLRAALSPRAA